MHRQIAALRWTALLARITRLLAGFFSLAQDGWSVTLAWDLDTDPSVVGYRPYCGRNAPGAESRREPQRRPEKPRKAGRGPGTRHRRGVPPVTGYCRG
jgi:hypothetical protein